MKCFIVRFCVCVWDNLFSFSLLWLCLYRWGCLFNSDSYFSFHLMFSSQGYRQGLCLARKIVALSSRESSHRLLQSDMFPQTSCRLHLNHTPLISSHLISAAHMCVLVHSHVFVPALLIFPTCSCFMLCVYMCMHHVYCWFSSRSFTVLMCLYIRKHTFMHVSMYRTSFFFASHLICHALSWSCSQKIWNRTFKNGSSESNMIFTTTNQQNQMLSYMH